jgi:7-cyano-7-deazaguanine reductase
MGQSGEQVLGREVRGPIGAEGLDVAPWSHGDKDAVVEFTANELTALCPITGQPDFYELTLNYRPNESLIESKSLKLYLWGFRDRESSPKTSPPPSCKTSSRPATRPR